MTTAQDFTLEELLIARMSREFSGENMGVGATILSDLAARLAKATHAPDLFLTTVSRGAADPDIHAKSPLEEWVLAQSARISLDWQTMFDLVAQDRLQIWIGTVQIDRRGYSNISVVGPWAKPKIQLIGARGVPDDLWGCKRLCYHVRRHTPRSFVERVDFPCSFGFGPERERYGSRAALPGPVISDLGVFDFDHSAGEMRIVSLHPGVSFEEVSKRTGFAFPEPSGDLAVTPGPTAEELRIIREVIDPLGMRRLEAQDADDKLAVELWQAEVDRLKISVREKRA